LNNIAFAISYKDLDFYSEIVFERKDRVTEAIKELIDTKDTHDWYGLFSLLCEYQSVLFHFENVLESITLSGDVDVENKRWLIDKEVATKLSVYVASENICRQELNYHNLSFSSH
jgi:hypothetical protein